jgi:hypothetical protein
MKDDNGVTPCRGGGLKPPPRNRAPTQAKLRVDASLLFLPTNDQSSSSSRTYSASEGKSVLTKGGSCSALF